MPAALEPPELDRVVSFAERSRVGDWSLRSALVRYAQSQPERVSQVLELVRRIELALGPQAKLLQREGPAVWQAVESGVAPGSGSMPLVVGLLRAASALDGLADLLAAWAVDRTGERPDAAVDAVVLAVTTRLDDLGVTREERQRPPGRRA